MMSYYTRKFEDFATNRESDGVPYDEMLSWDLTARKFNQRLGEGRMNHILNCKGAKANELTYKSLSWKSIRCYDGKVSHDGDPWAPDDKSMRLGVPNHYIDIDKPLKDQKWLGEYSVSDAVPCIVKALCICDVLFGFDGHKDSIPVGTTDPFAIPEDLLGNADAMKPPRPGTAVIKSRNGNRESVLQERLLWTDNYNPLYSRFRAIAYMGLPRDAVEVEDFDYDKLLHQIRSDSATADARGLNADDLKTIASSLLKYKLYMKQLDLFTTEEILRHLRSRGVHDMDEQVG